MTFKAFNISSFIRFAGTAFPLFVCFSLHAQLEIQPAPRQNNAKRVTVNPAGRTKQEATLYLPFWDDFSTPHGNYPDTSRWTDSYSIWINDGMAINQPTINVATFDGLDSAGLAYNPTEILVTGYTDELVSRPVDLSEDTLSVAERDGVYFSFFYQWEGNGEAPDASDYLELEFRNVDGAWESMMRIFPEDDFDRNIFYDTIIKVAGDQFFHHEFQFRFRSFGRQSGPYDTWNIDYVYLNKGRTPDDNSYPERAAASSPGPLFGEYTAIPYRHFGAWNPMQAVKFDVTNLKNTTTPVSINYRATAKFTNYFESDTTVYTTTLVASEGVKGTTGIMFPLERTTVSLSTLPDAEDPQQFHPDAQAVDVELKMKVISSDSIDEDRTRFSPINLQVNDTVSATYSLRDYYAYDDGVAEYAAGLIEPGNLIAYQFEMPPGQTDTLIAFRIHLVPYGVTNNQTITFYIYHDDNGRPGEVWQTISSQRIERKEANEFQTITWLPAILVDEPRFYIGWKQPVAGKALVGLDIDNDTGSRIFVNTTSSWYQNQEVSGSLMIRPVFGKGEVDVVSGIEDEHEVAVYPNPSSGSFWIEGDFDHVRMFDLSGNEITFECDTEHDRKLVRTNRPAGLYVLQLRKGSAMITRKIVITR